MRSVLIVLVLVVSACASDPGGTAPPSTSSAPSDDVAELAFDEIVHDGLQGPTQIAFGPDGRLWAAQLAGGENAGQGQVLVLGPDASDREVVVDGLTKPTGLAWLDGDLWIAAANTLLRVPDGDAAQLETVLDDLPFNGRSNGTLTVRDDTTLLFNTSGREGAGAGVDGSGVLFALNPERPDEPTPLASGLKNAYAHVVDGDGVLWSTEVAEPLGGVAAPDELNRITDDGDYGWPGCLGARPVPAFGGDDQRCGQTLAPVAEFGVGTTPTSVVVSPFADDELLVALWNAGQIVAVPTTDPARQRVVVDDAALPRPQHLLVDGETVLVSDFETGQIRRLRPRKN